MSPLSLQQTRLARPGLNEAWMRGTSIHLSAPKFWLALSQAATPSLYSYSFPFFWGVLAASSLPTSSALCVVGLTQQHPSQQWNVLQLALACI